MRSLTFPYIRLRTIYLPIVPLTLFSRISALKTEAYVDSGAFYSIFRIEALDDLQLSKEQGRPNLLKAADGRLIRSFLFRLPIMLGDVKLRALIAFSEDLNVGFNLLGRQTIFNAFDEVAFNERKKIVVFRRGD